MIFGDVTEEDLGETFVTIVMVNIDVPNFRHPVLIPILTKVVSEDVLAANTPPSIALSEECTD